MKGRHFPCRFMQARIVAMLLLAMASGAVPARVAEPEVSKKASSIETPPQRPDRPTLEESLLKDLDNELLEGAGDLKIRPKTKTPATDPAGGEKKAIDPSDAGEDIAAPPRDGDPLVRISEDMRKVERLIAGETRDGTPEPIQKEILKELARLIEDAEKQAAAQQASSGKKSQSQQVNKRQSVKQSKPSPGNGKPTNQPAQDSNDQLRQAEAARVDAAAVKGMLKDSWGNLPPKAREQMLQNSPEQFLPQYELLIERYYKRLAEEQNSK